MTGLVLSILFGLLAGLVVAASVFATRLIVRCRLHRRRANKQFMIGYRAGLRQARAIWQR